MIQTISLSQGVTLRCFPCGRFKQSLLSVQFLSPMARETAALNALLPAVLLRGCEGAPDIRTITERLDDLYGAATGAICRRVGDYQAIGLSCSFVEDAYAMEGDAILAPMLQFLGQLLLQPVLENGVFRRDVVDSEKKNLIAAIESNLNNKRAYAMQQLLKKMCREDSYGISQYGETQDVAAITPEALYTHYRDILENCPVDIFYVGSQDPQRVSELLKPLFSSGQRRPLPPQTGFHPCPETDSSEAMDVAQGKLCMGYVTDITVRDPRFAAMQVCNTVLGAGMTSKLFMQVREKLSLCYDIGSGYHGSKGLVLVSAGIDFDREDQVRAEVARQLQLCRDGCIAPEELRSAKEQLLSQLRTVDDAPGSIENYYATAALSGIGMDPVQYARAVEAVTPEEVAAAAKTVALHSVFFLKGVQ